MKTAISHWKVHKMVNLSTEINGEKVDIRLPTEYAIFAHPVQGNPLLISYVISQEDAEHIVKLHNDKISSSK